MYEVSTRYLTYRSNNPTRHAQKVTGDTTWCASSHALAEVTCVALCNDGFLATGSGDTARVWDESSSKPLLEVRAGAPVTERSRSHLHFNF